MKRSAFTLPQTFWRREVPFNSKRTPACTNLSRIVSAAVVFAFITSYQFATGNCEATTTEVDTHERTDNLAVVPYSGWMPSCNGLRMTGNGACVSMAATSSTTGSTLAPCKATKTTV